MLKKIALAASVAALTLPLAALADTNISAAGSTALLPLVKESAQEYQATHNGVNISVAGGGSFVGITQAKSGAADMGDSDVIVPEARNLIDHKVAVVGFAIAVNPSAGVHNLTTKQLQGIFSGKITNWKEVGGSDQQIVVINRPRSSGTRFVFTKTVMGSTPISETSLVEDSSGAVMKMVEQTPGALTYVSLSYTENQPATVVSVNGVAATVANIRTGKYPIWSYEHIFTKTKNTAIEDFINFISHNSDALTKLGYIEVGSMKVHESDR